MAWNSDNVAVGFEAMYSNQPTSSASGKANTALGTQALKANTTGSDNTAAGNLALDSNTSGSNNTAVGTGALSNNTSGIRNTAVGHEALFNNVDGNGNTSIGFGAGVLGTNLSNATALGAGAIVDASNKVRIGNTAVTAIHGQVGFTATSDRTKKENFQPVDGAEVLRKIRGFPLTSWNFIGHDPKQFRHYGPMAQDFYAAFGHDGVGAIGTETTINNADLSGILLSAVQALDKENTTLRAEAAAAHNHAAEARKAAAAANQRLAQLEARLTKLEQLTPATPKDRAAKVALKN